MIGSMAKAVIRMNSIRMYKIASRRSRLLIVDSLRRFTRIRNSSTLFPGAGYVGKPFICHRSARLGCGHGLFASWYVHRPTIRTAVVVGGPQFSDMFCFHGVAAEKLTNEKLVRLNRRVNQQASWIRAPTGTTATETPPLRPPISASTPQSTGGARKFTTPEHRHIANHLRP